MINKKGQSSIEYLTTYGWMLLVVAIAGGTIFSVANNQQTDRINGFNNNIQISDFGTTDDPSLQLNLQNTGSENLRLKTVNITKNNSYSTWTGNQRLSTGDTQNIVLANISQTENTNELNIKITYDAGSLTNLETSGTLAGGFKITNNGSTGSTPEPMTSEDDFQVTQQ